MNDQTLTCEQCELQLFEFHEGKLGPATSALIDEHLQDCDTCSCLLNDIWQMGLVASRWQEQKVPHQGQSVSPSSQPARWQMPQIFATAASLLAILLVLTDAHLVSTDQGYALTFGSAGYVTEKMFTDAQQEQETTINQRLDRLTAQQVASDQLVLNSVLEASRQERREEWSSLVTFWNSAQARQYQDTEADLRYLLASQAEDEKDIKQLSAAFQQIRLNNSRDM